MENSIDAFVIFKNSLKSPKKYKNGNHSFFGEVIYKTRGKVFSGNFNVTFKEGFESGKISIDDNGYLKAHGCYADFHLDYQDYTISNEGYLIIQGSDYEVVIRQV